MLFSVVIPWHRNVDDLHRAISSILSQTWQGFEMIIVANNVTDEVYAEAQGVCSDPRIKIVRTPIPGASNARNMGKSLAEGELIFFLDADDVFLPDKLSVFASAYSAEPFDLAFSRGIRDRGFGVETPMPETFWNGSTPIAEFFFVQSGNISSTALVVSKAAAARLNFTLVPPYEDPDFVIQAEYMGMRIRMLPDILFRWSDFRSEGRLSRSVDVDSRLSWIDTQPDNVSQKARCAFRARCVAQHVFPSRFALCLRLFSEAVRCGGLPYHQVVLFMMRGFIPTRLRTWLLDRYFVLRAKQAMREG